MATESSANPPQAQTHAQSATNAQWSKIPIDPALQSTTSPYQHYQYASHYPPHSYPTHYQPYGHTPVSAQPTSQQVAQARQTTLPAASAQTSSGMDTADIATLNDALGSAGVDLRAEEESLQRSQDQHQSYRSYEDRTRKQPLSPSFDTRILGTTMRTISTQHKISRISEDTVTYVALALRARLQDLITAMVAAAHHRTDTQFDKPATLYDDGTAMWSLVVRSDIAKQLAALEQVEREEETKVRRERKERMDMAAAHAAALAAQANGMSSSLGLGQGDSMDDGEGNSKKKRKKEGPGVTARNMSEDVRKKMSNAVATQAAGLGGKYAWMTAANTASPKSKPAPATPAGNVASLAGGTASSWARPYVPTKKSTSVAPAANEEDTRTLVTKRDALFVVEKDRGHGGGRGMARGYV